MRSLKTVTASSLLALLAVSQPARAQDDATPQDTAASSRDDAIVVTGSRITRSTFNSPTPITVIGAEQIAAMGQVNIAETLTTLPQNVSKSSETNTGLNASTQQYNVGASIADLRGLNPLNGVRTLTLVNTKRFVPSTTGGGVDMNMIPSMLVKSVETVTGGASAAYGTDALAGVVNIILDTKLTGIKAQFDYGQTFHNDGKTYHGSIAAGTGFAGGRGHFIFGAEWQNSGEVGDCVYARSWCARSPDIWINEQNATNGQPRYVRGYEGAYANYDLSTVLRGSTLAPRVNAPGLRNLVFSDDGRSVIEYDPGKYFQAIGFGERQGGDCTLDCSPWSEVQLRPQIERMSFYSRGEFEFTPGLKGFIEGSYGRRESSVNSISLGPSSGTPLRTDYAYLDGVTYFDRATGQTLLLSDLIAATAPSPGAVGAVSQAPGVPPVPLFVAKHFRNVPGGRAHIDADLESLRFMGGFEGEIGLLGSTWKWDAYYQYGKTKQFVTNSGIRVNRFFMYALDAVDEGLATTGVANGNIVCRATLPGPANTATPPGFEQHWGQADAAGCVPLNILGTNTESPEAIAYAYRQATEDFHYKQHVAAFNLSGRLFDGWAGPVSLALGGEYRFEKGFAEHNKLPFNVTNTNSPFGNDFGGSLKILEGYVETNIPLLRDLPLVRNLELDAAFRRTEQTNKDALTGRSKDLGFNTWKISGTWDVTDWLRFRATRSRDVRAASFVDLYYNLPDTLPGPPAGTILNPWFLQNNGAATNDFTKIIYPPNFELTPEIGDTFTVGVVLQPRGFLDGLRLSVDYYNIKIKDAITVLTAQQVVDACFNAGVVCDKIFDGSGASFATVTDPTQRRDVENLQRGAVNIGSFELSGWDVELLYALPLDKLGNLPGTVTFRGLATITDKMLVNLGNGSGSIDYRNQTGGSAFGGFTAPSKYILNGYLSYNVGGFGMTLDGKYIPKGIYDIRRDASLPNTNLNSINYNTVDSRFYVGLSTSYKFELGGNDTAEVFFTVRNLFDVDPPHAPSNVSGTLGFVQGGGAPTNPVFYDTIGATWRAGMRVNF